jgi:alkanesulfonate monooxygenase SsuD/methylene tetrahydromethanopterin reductase-like flavin-dependent oxidoreductase (luciferase family)
VRDNAEVQRKWQEEGTVARHPWVAGADQGIRWAVQLIVPNERNALARLVDTANRVEELGYDFLSIFDHPLVHVDPWIALSGLATRTSRVRLGSTVNCAVYRHPAHLARLATDLDNLSNGRHILGLGSGWFEAEFAALGRDFGTFSDRNAALDDTLAIVHGVWSNSPFTYEGKVFSTVGMEAEPRPVQQPRPPIMVAGNGEKVTLRQVAKWADACNVKEMESLSDRSIPDATRAASVRRLLEILDGHCEALDRDPAEVLRTHFTLYLILGETMDEAQAKANNLDTSKSTSPGTRRHGQTMMLVTDIAGAISYYQAMAEIGIQYFIVQLDARDAQTIELLKTKVAPQVA